MTALKKSTIAFDKAVDEVKSFAGTDSGKVALLLPAAYLVRNHDELPVDN
jgi:hypothetical protein